MAFAFVSSHFLCHLNFCLPLVQNIQPPKPVNNDNSLSEIGTLQDKAVQALLVGHVHGVLTGQEW